MSTRAEHPEIVNSNKQIFTKPFIFIARSREILVFENKKKNYKLVWHKIKTQIFVCVYPMWWLYINLPFKKKKRINQGPSPLPISACK